MNTLVIVLIAAVVLVCAYAGYGRWLAKTWGVDPNAKTPAVRLEDGKDYVPTNGWTVFAHQFSSIAGAGPVTGAIQAAAFGFLLTQIGYANIWPLFGSANQLLSALVLATLCVFLKVTGRNNKMLFPPLVIMLCVTFTALVQRLIAMVKAISAAAATAIPAGETTWGAVFIANGLQLILAILLIVLGLNIVFHSVKSYKASEKNSEKASV